MKRHYGLDLLRILAMFFVVLRHGVVSSEITWHVNPSDPGFLFGQVAMIVTSVAVNCFVLITGFFLSQQPFRPKRLLSFWFVVFGYSMAVFGVWELLARCPGLFGFTANLSAPTFRDFLCSFFPISGFSYWFMSMYFALVLVSPFLNHAVNCVTKRDGAVALAAALFFLSVLPSMGLDSWVKASGGFTFQWFVVVYLAGAWLRRFHSDPETLVPTDRRSWKASVFGYALLLAVSVGYLGLRQVLKNRGIELGKAEMYNFPPTFLASVLVFRFFQALRIDSEAVRKGIVFFAPLMLGVYLFHDHPLKSVLWRDFLGINAMPRGLTWPLGLLGRVVLVFAAGVALEYLRRKLASLIRPRRA